MAGTATITGKTGAAQTLTAQVFTGVKFFSLDTDNEVLFIKCDQGEFYIDVSAQTTWTLTVSGNTYTLTVA